MSRRSDLFAASCLNVRVRCGGFFGVAWPMTGTLSLGETDSPTWDQSWDLEACQSLCRMASTRSVGEEQVETRPGGMLASRLGRIRSRCTLHQLNAGEARKRSARSASSVTTLQPPRSGRLQGIFRQANLLEGLQSLHSSYRRRVDTRTDHNSRSMPSLHTITAVLAVLTCINLTISAGSGSSILCPIVGPAPPAQCDGRDRTWFPISVVGSGTFCTRGPEVCVADQLAACPGPSDQLPYGAKCVQFTSNVYGCVPKTSCDDGVLNPGDTSSSTTSACEAGCAIDSLIPRQCNGSNGWTPVSVVGSATYCVRGPVCSGRAQASCPQPQRGLPFGSTCERIPTGVFGCIKNTRCQAECSTALSSLGRNTVDHGRIASDAHETPMSTLTSIETTAPLSVATTPAPTNAPAVLTAALAGTDFHDDDNAVVSGFDEGDDDVALLPVPSIEDSAPVEDAETV